MAFSNPKELHTWLVGYRPTLDSYSRRHLPYLYEPDDAFHALYALLLKRMNSDGTIPLTQTYVFKCLRTVCNTYRRDCQDVARCEPTPQTETIDPAPNPEEEHALHELLTLVERERWGKLFLACVYGDRKAVARKEGISIDALDQRLYRVRQRLRPVFRELYPQYA